MQKGFIIAIDGPVASGKGTIAPLLAHKLQGFYLDTGVTFRCIALYCLVHGISYADEEAVAKVLPDIHIEYQGETIMLNGKDVGNTIRTSDVSRGSSIVAAQKAVREKATAVWRALAQTKEDQGMVFVAEGRDMGTVVFPEAPCKIFMTATPEVRAHRRQKQLESRGEKVSFEQVLKETLERDQRDSTRDISPLTTTSEADGYVAVDNSTIGEEETFAIILSELQKRSLL